MVYTLIGLVYLILAVVMYVIFAQVIVSWLIVFNVINLHSGPVRSIVQALDRITGPSIARSAKFCRISAGSTSRRWW